MLLSEGHVMYYGDAKSVVTWFDRLGQPCPFGTNIAGARGMGDSKGPGMRCGLRAQKAMQLR